MARDKKPVAVPGGLPCPKCRGQMQRYAHAAGWAPAPDRGYYRYWDLCDPCRHMQNYEEARVEPGPHPL